MTTKMRHKRHVVRTRTQAPDGELQGKYTTVAELYTTPPLWLSKQLAVYRQDPDRHFKPLCTSVAAVVLGDGLRWEEAQNEVRREVEEIPRGPWDRARAGSPRLPGGPRLRPLPNAGRPRAPQQRQRYKAA